MKKNKFFDPKNKNQVKPSLFDIKQEKSEKVSMSDDVNKSQESFPKADFKVWWQPAVTMFARMSGWIVVPVIIAVFLGKFLDAKYDIEPWGTLVSVALAFLISVQGIIKIARQEYQRIETKEKKLKANKTIKTIK